MTNRHSGQCACGAVVFGFDPEPGLVAVCHCRDCKRASGSEAMVLLGVPERDFTLVSGQPRAFHYTAASGKGLDRSFCPTCGARLFTSNLDGAPGTVFVTIGSLDHPERIRPVVEIFTRHRLGWAAALDIPQFESMPR
jgi:hypothetical protein